MLYRGGYGGGGYGGPGGDPPGSSEQNPSLVDLADPLPQNLVLTMNGQTYNLSAIPGGPTPSGPGYVANATLPLWDPYTHNFDLTVYSDSGTGTAVPGQPDPHLGNSTVSSYWTSQGYAFGPTVPAATKSHQYTHWYREYGGTFIGSTPPVSGDMVLVNYKRKEVWDVGQPLTRIFRSYYHAGHGGTIVVHADKNGHNGVYVKKDISFQLYTVQ